eukprot:308233-Rhodomonas_salina.3
MLLAHSINTLYTFLPRSINALLPHSICTLDTRTRDAAVEEEVEVLREFPKAVARRVTDVAVRRAV